ncbi:hypothetical protein [Halocella sp. SP3-1]|nr:hypothetical protein [Halocella sp. SP3-1]
MEKLKNEILISEVPGYPCFKGHYYEFKLDNPKIVEKDDKNANISLS